MINLLNSASNLDYAIIGYFGRIDRVTTGDEVDIIIKLKDFKSWVAILWKAKFINRGAVNLAKSTFMFVNVSTGIRVHLHIKYCISISGKNYYVTGSEQILRTKVKCPIHKTCHINPEWEEVAFNISTFKKYKRLGLIKFLSRDLYQSSKQYQQVKSQNFNGKASYIFRAYLGYKNLIWFSILFSAKKVN